MGVHVTDAANQIVAKISEIDAEIGRLNKLKKEMQTAPKLAKVCLDLFDRTEKYHNTNKPMPPAGVKLQATLDQTMEALETLYKKTVDKYGSLWL